MKIISYDFKLFGQNNNYYFVSTVGCGFNKKQVRKLKI